MRRDGPPTPPVLAPGSALALVLVFMLVFAVLVPVAGAGAADDPSPARGPTVILCLYGDDGRIRAGHDDCPPEARPADDMMPEAHCFYDARGRLWRGLPRCPRQAPAFLMTEAMNGATPED